MSLWFREGVRRRKKKHLKQTAFQEVFSFFFFLFPLHQSRLKTKWLSVSVTNESRHGVTVRPLSPGCVMFRTCQNIQPSRLLTAYCLEGLNIIAVVHLWNSFMRRPERPRLLIQRASYLQRCRSRSAVPVIAMPRRAGRYLHPLRLRPPLTFPLLPTVQIV